MKSMNHQVTIDWLMKEWWISRIMHFVSRLTPLISEIMTSIGRRMPSNFWFCCIPTVSSRPQSLRYLPNQRWISLKSCGLVGGGLCWGFPGNWLYHLPFRNTFFVAKTCSLENVFKTLQGICRVCLQVFLFMSTIPNDDSDSKWNCLGRSSLPPAPVQGMRAVG